MEPRNVVLSFRISASAKAELQRRADAERRKLSDYMALLIEDYLAVTAHTPPSSQRAAARKAKR
jgi:hypothetical protein